MTRDQIGSLALLLPRGGLTHAEASVLRAAALELVEAHAGRLAVDLSAVPLIDSAALDALADAADRCQALGHPGRLIGANDAVLDVLRITGAASLFRVFESAAAAARDLS